jgi:hypothetical protein
MRTAVRLLILTMALLLSSALADSGKAWAGGMFGAGTLWLSCENGSEYPIRAIAVSDEGDLVTGYLVMGQRQGVYIRLVPMGASYRYAGRGLWFDGARENVYLYTSKYRPIACTVVRGPEQVRRVER